MTEIEKLQYTKNFIDKLADGINPIDGTAIPEGDLLNNVRISRCMFYVSGFLTQAIENGIGKKAKKTDKLPFYIDSDTLSDIRLFECPVGITEFLSVINERVDSDKMKTLSTTSVTGWLVTKGFLDVVELPNGKSARRPTESGNSLGIITEVRNGLHGDYTAVLYNKSAQQFILDNIEAIIGFINTK